MKSKEIPSTLSPADNEFKNKIKPFLEKMILAITIDKPDNIPLYMTNWLKQYGGFPSTGLSVEEKEELENLRQEIKKYREWDDQQSQVIAPNNSINDQIISEKEEVLTDEEDDIDPNLDNVEYTKKKMSVVQRGEVSAEVYGSFNKRENFVPQEHPKTSEQYEDIKIKVLNSFLFRAWEPKDLDIVIKAMHEKRYRQGDTVITQGEYGDCVFWIDSGHWECFKKFAIDEAEKMVKRYEPGDSFGEWALLYNSPRAATVKAIDDVVIWSWDRETFNHIVKDSAQKKREYYETILKQVEILATIDPYEVMQISDALKSSVYHKGEYIIKQGEIGDVFYILEEGVCDATKAIEPGKPDQLIKEYHQGEYFGERALIKGEPRFANIIAKTDIVKAISLDRYSFKRLLGPIEEWLKRNMEKYETFMNSSTGEEGVNKVGDKVEEREGEGEGEGLEEKDGKGASES